MIDELHWRELFARSQDNLATQGYTIPEAAVIIIGQ